MVALDAPTSFSNTPSPWKKVGLIVLGGSLVTYYALIGVKSRAEERRRAMSRPLTSSEYKASDAMSVTHRPAKNANVKGSMPSASKWV